MGQGLASNYPNAINANPATDNGIGVNWDFGVPAPGTTSPAVYKFLFSDPAPAPTTGAPTPSSGPTGGGTSITLTGTNLTGASVTVGGAACTTVVVNSAGTSLTCTTPPGTASPQPVVVTTAGGTANTTLTYVAAPAPPAPRPVKNLDVTGGPHAKHYLVTWGKPARGAPVTGYRITIKLIKFNKLILRKLLAAYTTSYPVTRKFLLRQTFHSRGDVITGTCATA